jgi:hypothetical protein
MEALGNSKAQFGSLTLRLLLSEAHDEVNTKSFELGSKSHTTVGGIRTLTVRVLMVIAGFWFWFRGAEYMMSFSTPVPAKFDLNIDDFGHKIAAPLVKICSPRILKNTQHLLTDCGMFYILSSTLYGESTVCVLSGLFALASRTILLFLTPVIPTSNKVDKDLKLTMLPKFFGNGDKIVNTTHFISLHVIVSVIVFLHIWGNCLKPKRTSAIYWCLAVLSGLTVATEILISLTLCENWSFDIVISIALAVFCFNQASWISPSFDYVKSL